MVLSLDKRQALDNLFGVKAAEVGSTGITESLKNHMVKKNGQVVSALVVNRSLKVLALPCDLNTWKWKRHGRFWAL